MFGARLEHAAGVKTAIGLGMVMARFKITVTLNTRPHVTVMFRMMHGASSSSECRYGVWLWVISSFFNSDHINHYRATPGSLYDSC